MYIKNKIGKSKILDVVTCMHKEYVYDIPVARHTLKSYTTLLTNTIVLDISNQKV